MDYYDNGLDEGELEVSEVPWVTMQAIINGTASIGGRTGNKTAPATAEKAKPTKRNTALRSIPSGVQKTHGLLLYVVKAGCGSSVGRFAKGGGLIALGNCPPAGVISGGRAISSWTTPT